MNISSSLTNNIQLQLIMRVVIPQHFTKAFIQRFLKKTCFRRISRFFNQEIIEDDDDMQELDEKLIPQINDPEVSKLVDEFMKQDQEEQKESDLESKLQMEDVDKLTNDIFKSQNDKVFELFAKVVSTDKDQVIRYCRENVPPLWFCQENIISQKNMKCANCQSKASYEFQIMPHIFNMYKEIMNINIGTIIIFSCVNSCNKTEESFYIQRTGEAILETEGNTIKMTQKVGNLSIDNINSNTNQNQPKKKTEELDEDGFTIVKKKKK